MCLASSDARNTAAAATSTGRRARRAAAPWPGSCPSPVADLVGQVVTPPGRAASRRSRCGCSRRGCWPGRAGRARPVSASTAALPAVSPGVGDAGTAGEQRRAVEDRPAAGGPQHRRRAADAHVGRRGGRGRSPGPTPPARSDRATRSSRRRTTWFGHHIERRVAPDVSSTTSLDRRTRRWHRRRGPVRPTRGRDPARRSPRPAPSGTSTLADRGPAWAQATALACRCRCPTATEPAPTATTDPAVRSLFTAAERAVPAVSRGARCR